MPAFGATKSVNIGDLYFISKAKNKSTITAKVGDKIKFKWVGKQPHNVVSSSGPSKIDSGNAKKSGTYTTKALKKGTYKLFCEIHTKAKQALTVKVS
ncbi:MAG TPA: plastocyanin/azurin family copper-binding protein [Solirubrobacteraceae bacterium]|nr:plastocyanin/azurin family copper-binding protein [Solirubrobacteraceae bacterium]